MTFSHRRPARGLSLLLAGLVLAAGPSWAHPPHVHALTGVRIVVYPGRVIESGTVVMRDGVITAAGSDVAIPADARIWEREGATVYAGLIDPYVEMPWPDEGEEKDRPQGGHENALVTPERQMSLHAFDAGKAEKLRRAGFTTAVVVPEPGLFRGSAAILNLGDGSAGNNLLRTGVAQAVSLRSNSFRGGYPSSLMGAVALFRQALLDAAWYRRAERAYAADPAQERPAFNRALQALGPVAAGEETVLFETENLLGSLRAASLTQELGLTVYLVGNGEEYKRLEEIRSAGLPHLLPLTFPEPPQVSPEDDDLSVELADLRHWDQAPSNPARLLDAGLTVAFTSHGLDDPSKLWKKLSEALPRGLDAERALAALTTTPARLFGLEKRAGTVEPGKMANLVVVDGDLFVERPKILEVWVDGRRYELEERKPPEVEPAGTWELTASTAGGFQFPLGLRLEGKAPTLSGVAIVRGNEVPLTSAEVSAKTLIVEIDGAAAGMSGTIRLELEIEGESARGSGSGPRGAFQVEGQRTVTPEGERGRAQARMRRASGEEERR